MENQFFPILWRTILTSAGNFSRGKRWQLKIRKNIRPKTCRKCWQSGMKLWMKAGAFPTRGLWYRKAQANSFAGKAIAGSLLTKASGKIHGLYILHPNNVGRCGHLSNASYAVSKISVIGAIGRLLVEDSLEIAGELGFRILQFNAVGKKCRRESPHENLVLCPWAVFQADFCARTAFNEDILPLLPSGGEGAFKTGIIALWHDGNNRAFRNVLRRGFRADRSGGNAD